MNPTVMIIGLIVEIFIMCKFTFSLLEELRYDKKLSVVIFVVAHFLDSAKSFWFLENIFLKSLISWFYAILIMQVLFKDKLYRKVMVHVLYLSCVFFAEVLALLMAKYIYKCDISDLESASIRTYLWQATSYLLIFVFSTLVLLLVERRFINPKSEVFQYMYLYMSAQFLLILMFIVLIFDYDIASDIIIISILAVIGITLFIAFMLYKTTRITERRSAEAEFVKREAEIKDKHFCELKEQYVEFRKLRHDFYNHIKIIDSLDDSEKIKEYTNEIKQKFDKLEQVSFCNNLTLDALLSLKRTEAKQQGININISVCDLTGIFVSDYDLCTLVSNLMDNAITASLATSPKQISFKISRKMERLIISVKNSSMPVDSELKTTKPDSRNHGMGLSIIKNLAQKYDGDSVFRYDDGEFLSVVTLCCSK